MPVIIIESPNKVKKLTAISGMKVLATVGHFKDLPVKELGVDVQHNYMPDFRLVPEKKDILNRIKTACRGEIVYIASDPDREGYAIGTMVYEEIRREAKEIWRLEIHEITEHGFKEAMLHCVPFEKTNHGFYDAFLGRRVADRIVGYTLSPITNGAIGSRTEHYSVGRVQSPAVRLVVDRDLDVKNFKPVPFWTITILLEKDGVRFTATDVEGHYDYKDEAKEALPLIAADHAVCINAEKKMAQSKPKPPFTTVDMQAAAGTQLKMSPEKTMQVAQQLFEAGLITYHRTDSVRIADEFIEEIREYVSMEFGAEYVPQSPLTHKSKNSQADAHEGIRPTHMHKLSECQKVVEHEQLSQVHVTLYELIYKRTVASQMAPAVYDTIKYVFKVPYPALSTKGYDFKASGRILRQDGYLKLTNDDEGDHDVILPDITLNEKVRKLSTDLKEGYTKPPALYTEATLIKRLEALGIGRPSTYASIISIIKKRKYVTIEKGKLVATSAGIKLTDYLKKKHLWVVDYDMTGLMEEYLDIVEAGKAQWQSMIKEIHGRIGFAEFGTAEARRPSEKQLAYANKLAEKTGIRIPQSAFDSSSELSSFIDKASNKSEQAFKEAQQTKQLSEKQLAVIKKNAPDIYKKVQAGDMKSGHKFLDSFFKKKSK